MGKLLTVLTVVCALFFTGCEAFKSSYDPTSATNASSDQVPTPGDAEGAGATGGTTTVGEPYECTNVETAVVAYLTDQTEFANDGWTADNGEFTVTAKAIDDSTTSFEISNDAGKLTFVLKKLEDEVFNVCSVVYEGCDGECLGVKSLWTDVKEALFDVYAFNAEGKNAGHFKITFGESSMGDAGMTLEGGYSAEELSE